MAKDIDTNEMSNSYLTTRPTDRFSIRKIRVLLGGLAIPQWRYDMLSPRFGCGGRGWVVVGGGFGYLIL